MRRPLVNVSMAYRYHAVLMDFGSVRAARMEVTSRSQAHQLQVHDHLYYLDHTLLRNRGSRPQTLGDLNCLKVLV